MRKMGWRGRAGRVLLAAMLLTSQLLVLAAPAPACDRSINAEVLAHLGGSQLGKVVIAGDYAFAGAAGGLVVFDVSDPANPSVVAQVSLPGDVNDLAVAGSFVYAVGTWGDVQIIDVTDPTAPVKRGATGWGDVMRGVAVSGNRVFVTSDYHGFKVVDVADKDEPYLIGMAGPPTSAQYYDVAIVGTKAYVSYGASDATVRKIRCFNITGSTPAQLGVDYTVTGTSVSVRSLTASGSLVFAAEAARGLEIVDFTAPSAPVQRGTYGVVGAGGFDVAFGGATLYLAAGDAGLKALNVSNPAAPALLGTLGETCTGVAVSGALACLTNGPTLTTADVTAPATMIASGSVRLVPADAKDVARYGGYAIVAAGSDGVLKVSVDTTPVTIVGKSTAVTDAQKVVVAGDYAYVGDASALKTFNVSGDDPAYLGGTGVGEPVEGMCVDGDRLYVAAGDAGLLVYSIATPGTPALVGTYVDPDPDPVGSIVELALHALPWTPPSGTTGMGPVHAVAASGERVYIGINGGNVVSLDAANPAAITERTRMGTYGDVLSLSLDGDSLYAGTSEKVYRIDASDPEDVFQIGHYYYFGERVVDVDGWGPYAFAATDAGFYLIDFSDAASPYIATDFGEGYMACGGVEADEGGVYLAARESGYYQLRVPVLRTAGSSRYDTAVELSKANWPTATHVVLATGANFADAACAAPLAHALGGPLLLTHPVYGLTQPILDEIVRLGVTDVVIIGNDKAVPASVDTALNGLGITNDHIKRLAGWNRYDTARMVAHEFKVAKGSDPATAFVATGDNFPDALTVSGVAAALDCPVLLVRRTAIPTPTAEAIADLGNPDLIAVGSSDAISEDVYNELGCVDRIWGDNRYETAKEVADYAVGKGFDPAKIIVTTGQNFPDALVSGVVSAKQECPILLTREYLPSATSGFLNEHLDEIVDITVIGSSRAVSQSVEDQIIDTVRQ